MKIAVLTIGGKGGVGKTTTALLTTLYLRQKGYELKLFDADNRPKLANHCKGDDVVSLGRGPKIEDLRNDPDLFDEHWDKVGNAMLEGNVLLDCGAGMDEPIIEYMKRSQVGNFMEQMGVTPVFIYTAVADSDSLGGVEPMIETIKATFPQAKVMVVLNEKMGRFEGSFDKVLGRLTERADRKEIGLIRLSALNGSGWVKFWKTEPDPDELLELTDPQAGKLPELSKRIGETPLAAGRLASTVFNWLKDFVDQFESTRLIPDQGAPARRAEAEPAE